VKSELPIYLPVALKLHAYGLFRLQDSEWCGTELYDRAKAPYRGRVDPQGLFREPLPDGFLFQLGTWLFDDYLESEDVFHYRDFDFVWEYMEDFRQLLLYGGIPSADPLLRRIANFLEHLQRIYDDSSEEKEQPTDTNKYRLKSFHELLWRRFATPLSQLRTLYARDYAERVFHDRQLCGYISQIILDIGIDGTVDGEAPGQWCPRLTFPAWVRNALISRERGKCAACRLDLSFELNGIGHVDHIIPLASGGCNDLVNLQMLCDTCNLKKSVEAWPVTSSVPPYLERALKKRKSG
jgi:HNH endonuclease